MDMTITKNTTPRLVASGLAVAAMLTAATGMTFTANADTLESDEPVLTVMTFGSGKDSNVGEYKYDVQVLDRSTGSTTPMQSLGTLTNSVDLSDKHAGVSGVDLSGILDNVTLDQLQEWSEKGWVSAQGSDGTTYYNANLAVIETVGNTGVEQLGGYGMNNGRAVTVGLVFAVTDDNKVSYTISSVSGGTGAVNLPEAPSDQIDEYSMATAFANATVETVEGVGHKEWKDEEDAKADSLTKAYANRFNFDLRYTPKEGDTDQHLDNDTYEFSNQKDAVWDENGDIDFGELNVSLTDALGVSTEPLDSSQKDVYYDTTAFDTAFSDTLTFDVIEENQYDATQVTLPSPTDTPDLIVNVEWKPATNTFKLTQADDVDIVNEYAAPDDATVTFNTQTSDVKAPEPETTVPGQSVKEPTISRDGYVFTGWYIDPVCTVPYDFSTAVPEDITLYAGWEKVAEGKITVNFDAQAEGVNNPDTQVIDKGTTAEMPTVHRDGYSFAGWYTDPECTQVFDFSAPVSDNITLYARWSQNPGTDENPNQTTDPDQKPTGDGQQTDGQQDPDQTTGDPQSTQGLAQTGIGIITSVMSALALAAAGAGAAIIRRRHSTR